LSQEITGYKVFIASPGGLDDERLAFRDVIREYNESEALHRDVMFRAIGWEDAMGGVGRPQSIINEEVKQCDFMVLVLWDRWGSSTGRNPREGYSSGTEEEFRLAEKCLADAGLLMRDVLVTFKAVDPRQLSDPGDQLNQVLDFKKGLEKSKKHLYEGFDSTKGFGALLRKHLAGWKRRHEDGWGDQDSGGESQPTSPDFDGGGSGLLLPDLDEGSQTANAWRLADEGRTTEAEVEFAKAVVGPGRADSMVSYAQFLMRQGRIDQATVFLHRAMEIAQSTGLDATVAVAQSTLGTILETRGNLDDAEEMYKQAVKIAENLNLMSVMSLAYSNLGFISQIRGDFDAAEEMMRKAVDIAERLNRPQSLAGQYGNLGIVLHIREDFDGAEEMFKRSLEIAEEQGLQELLSNAYGNLGIVYMKRDDLVKAEEMHRKSLEISEKQGRQEGIANSFGNLGNVFTERGDLDEAEEMHRKSLEIEEKLGRLEGMATDYGNLGGVRMAREDHDGAEEMYRKALEGEVRFGRQEGIAREYRNLGHVHRARGAFDEAEEMYQVSISMAEQMGLIRLVSQINSELEELEVARSDVEDGD
jgi:tetratricopeptide (TPR) repeat protein